MEALLSLSEHPAGVAVGTGIRVVYDLEADVAHLGPVSVSGPAVLWELMPTGSGTNRPPDAAEISLATPVTLDPSRVWLVRCDRVDFPPGAVAHRHVHPGPGIRRLLFGELTVTTAGATNTHRPGEPWFESGPEPVYARSSSTEASAFVRVMLLPAEWAGRRTIRYLDPVDRDSSARQRATIFLEEPLP